MSTQFFETIKCFEGEVFHLHYHKKRIASTIGQNINLEEYIYPPDDSYLRCKVIYDYNGIESIDYYPYTPKNTQSFQVINNDSLIYNKKFLDRSVLDRIFELKNGADDIIICKNGLLSDTSIANIACKINGNWYTPKTPLLYGTTRKRYLDNGILQEKDISIEQIDAIEEFALLNAMIDFKKIKNFRILIKD